MIGHIESCCVIGLPNKTWDQFSIRSGAEQHRCVLLHWDTKRRGRTRADQHQLHTYTDTQTQSIQVCRDF